MIWQRVRKVTESASGTIAYERIYLGSFELYRKYGSGGAITLERQTLHVMDDKQRISLVENLTQGSDGSPSQLVRYQFSNHLGSANLELDESAEIISYEEYYPYGSTSYQAVNQSIKAAAKRYRFTGKERDEETGFNYHGARYYAPWLGRWTSCDPAGLVDGVAMYVYVRSNPIRLADPSGQQSDEQSPLEQYYNDSTLHVVAGPPPDSANKYPKDRDPSPDETTVTKGKSGESVITLGNMIVTGDTPVGRAESPPAAEEKAVEGKQKESGNKAKDEADQPKEKVPDELTDLKLLAANPNTYKAVWLLILDYESKAHDAAERARQAGDMGRDANERYLAWNLARKDYGPVAGKPAYSVLRDAEHYLNRRWFASEPGMVRIPNGLPPPFKPGKWNLTTPWSESMMKWIFDPSYNLLREYIGEPLLGLSKTGPDMFYFEESGYMAGRLLASSSAADRKLGQHYEENALWLLNGGTRSGIYRNR